MTEVLEPLHGLSDGRRDDDQHEHSGLRMERVMAPRAVLLIFMAISFVTYFDRGAMAGALTVIRSDHDIRGSSRTLSDTKSGLLASGFMVGYMCFCPLMASLSGWVSSITIIRSGMTVWALSCVSTGLSNTYWMLLISRFVVGAGEAAYVGFTVTIIDSIAPPASRTMWLGLFYSMIPLGTAVGMATGGTVGSLGAIMGIAPWRMIFLGQVTASVPILVLLSLLPRSCNTDPRDVGTVTSFFEPFWILFTNPPYCLIVLGYAMYCFFVGAMGVWGIPMLIQGPLHLHPSLASLLMGGVTSAAGMVGTLAGGSVVDTLGGSSGIEGAAKCQMFNICMIAISIPTGVFCAWATGLTAFVVPFVIFVLALFSITAPVNASILSVVPHHLRPHGVSYSVFIIHLLGDFPSPVITGYLSDAFGRRCTSLLEDECLASTTNHCYWVQGGTEDSGHCVSEHQLRDAVQIVFLCFLLAIPCWSVAYICLKRVPRVEVTVHDGVEPLRDTFAISPVV